MKLKFIKNNKIKDFLEYMIPIKEKIINGILPAILITLPIGSVYAFSIFSTDMMNILQCSFKEIQFAFSLSIFFLGMGAAFCGGIVEKNIKKSAFISAILFSLGLICTSIGLHIKNIWMIYVGYGCLCGIAQGIGYLTPVKTLLMWFPNHKGLATAVSIISFGLGSSLCTALHGLIINYTGILNIFFIFSFIYLVMMVCGGIMIKKPFNEKLIKNNNVNYDFNYKNLFKDKFFIYSWFFMFLNISAGLSLIGSSVNIFNELELKKELIVVLMMLAGIFNGGFRLVFAWVSDLLKIRLNIWISIASISIICMTISSFYFPLVAVSILIINACYGGGFSTIPSILSEKYDLSCLSRVHGAVLSAWGMAGLIGNNISSIIFNLTNTFSFIPMVLVVIYIFNLFLVLKMKKLQNNY